MTIKLCDYGKFFSGRTHATEILEEEKLSTSDVPFLIDFDGVESFSQSFVSELIVAAKRHGVDLNNVVGENFYSEDLRKRFETELLRVKSL